MFSFWKTSKIESLDSQLQSEIDKWQGLMEKARDEIDRLNKIISEQGGEFIFDWETMDAFSIERDAEHTTIGYLHFPVHDAPQSEVKEWHYHCNLETHNRLAKEFREYLACRNAK